MPAAWLEKSWASDAKRPRSGEWRPHYHRRRGIVQGSSHCLDVTEVALFDPHAAAVGRCARAEVRADGQSFTQAPPRPPHHPYESYATPPSLVAPKADTPPPPPRKPHKFHAEPMLRELGSPHRSPPVRYSRSPRCNRIHSVCGRELLSPFTRGARSLNAEYAKIWPNIRVKKTPPPDWKLFTVRPHYVLVISSQKLRWCPYHRNTDDLGADWLDRLELMMVIEDQFAGVEITDTDIDQIEVVGDLIHYIETASTGCND